MSNSSKFTQHRGRFFFTGGLPVLIPLLCAGLICSCYEVLDPDDDSCMTCPDGGCKKCCSEKNCLGSDLCVDGVCVDCPTETCSLGGCCLGEPGCACCGDGDCLPTEECHRDRDGFTVLANFYNHCVENCIKQSVSCTGPSSEICCTGLVCAQDTGKCEQACDDDPECWQRPGPYPNDRICANQVCRYHGCQEDGDCLSSQLCVEGDCLTPSPCEAIARCAIGPGHPTVPVGGQQQLVAGAYLADDEPTLAEGYLFSTEQNPYLEVTPNGLLTGLAPGGPVTVTAQVSGCEIYSEVEVHATEF